MIDEWKRRLAEGASLDVLVRARPHAAQSRFVSVLDDGSMKIDLAAPAEDGKGNAALAKFLAAFFEVPVTHVKILSGKTARLKLVRIVAAVNR